MLKAAIIALGALIILYLGVCIGAGICEATIYLSLGEERFEEFKEEFNNKCNEFNDKCREPANGHSVKEALKVYARFIWGNMHAL